MPNLSLEKKLANLREYVLSANFKMARQCHDSITETEWTHVGQKAAKGIPEALTAISMSAELSDYFGDFKRAEDRLRDIHAEAENQLRSLVDDRSVAIKSLGERRTSKRWAWVVIQQGMVHYRSAQFDRALSLFRLCESACFKSIQDIPNYSAYGTLAKVHYGIALTYRERANYPLAKRFFSSSLEFAWQSLNEKMGPDTTETSFRQSRWTDVSIARALSLGLGFVYHAEGQPSLSLAFLLAAKNTLARLGEILISTYTDLIYYNARRASEGGSPEVLDDAINGLNRCYNVFKDQGHVLYQMRAAHSLALAYTQKARPDELLPLTLADQQALDSAERFCDELEQYAVKTGDSRSELYSLLCRSRIELKKGNPTLSAEYATQALDSGGDAHPTVRVDALIARAEANMRTVKTENWEQAADDLEKAIKKNEGNPRLLAVCLLRLTQIYASTGRSTSAKEAFDRWLQLKPQISNWHLRRLERQALGALEKVSADFVVRRSDDRLNPDDLERRLHGFLVEWALERSKTDRDAATLLGVSRQTLLNWKTASARAR